MTKYKIVKLQLNAAQEEIRELQRLVEGLNEEKKLLLLALKGYVQEQKPRKMTLADFDSPIDLEKVAEAL